jgi:hypothetical protein
MRLKGEYRDADMVIVSLPEKNSTGFVHHRDGIDMTERQAIDAIVAVLESRIERMKSQLVELGVEWSDNDTVAGADDAA